MTTEQLVLELGEYGWDAMPRPVENGRQAGGHFRGIGPRHDHRGATAFEIAAVYDAADRLYRRRVADPRRPEAAITGSTSLSPERTAAELRHRLQLGHEVAVDSVMAAVESLGCLLAPMPQGTGTITSFSTWIHDTPIMLLRASGANRRRVRFDAAHELGHLMMHRDRENSAGLEAEANQFAGSLLLPAGAFDGIAFKPFTWGAVQTVTDRCNVTMVATLRQALELQIISPVVYTAAAADASRRGWYKRDPYDVRTPEPFPIG
jgi:Zn-dependent peptidase ImmA (M78 family)